MAKDEIIGLFEYFMQTAKMTEKETLDQEFSWYIRLRDTDDTYHGKCITCKETFHMDDADNGHCYGRRKMTLRYFDGNCFMQCRKCNSHPDGRQEVFIKAIAERFGSTHTDDLLVYGHRMAKFDKFFYSDNIAYYREMNKKLRKLKLHGHQTPEELFVFDFNSYKQYLL